MIITVDGPAGAGKSTVSRRLAQTLELTYLNSGFIYRAVTLQVLESGGDFDDRDLVKRTIEVRRPRRFCFAGTTSAGVFAVANS